MRQRAGGVCAVFGSVCEILACTRVSFLVRLSVTWYLSRSTACFIACWIACILLSVVLSAVELLAVVIFCLMVLSIFGFCLSYLARERVLVLFLGLRLVGVWKMA